MCQRVPKCQRVPLSHLSPSPKKSKRQIEGTNHEVACHTNLTNFLGRPKKVDFVVLPMTIVSLKNSAAEL